jgi:hypothetical protein
VGQVAVGPAGHCSGHRRRVACAPCRGQLSDRKPHYQCPFRKSICRRCTSTDTRHNITVRGTRTRCLSEVQVNGVLRACYAAFCPAPGSSFAIAPRRRCRLEPLSPTGASGSSDPVRAHLKLRRRSGRANLEAIATRSKWSSPTSQRAVGCVREDASADWPVVVDANEVHRPPCGERIPAAPVRAVPRRAAFAIPTRPGRVREPPVLARKQRILELDPGCQERVRFGGVPGACINHEGGPILRTRRSNVLKLLAGLMVIGGGLASTTLPAVAEPDGNGQIITSEYYVKTPSGMIEQTTVLGSDWGSQTAVPFTIYYRTSGVVAMTGTLFTELGQGTDTFPGLPCAKYVLKYWHRVPPIQPGAVYFSVTNNETCVPQ